MTITGVSFVDNTGFGASSDYIWDSTSTVLENGENEAQYILQKLTTPSTALDTIASTNGAICLKKSSISYTLYVETVSAMSSHSGVTFRPSRTHNWIYNNTN